METITLPLPWWLIAIIAIIAVWLYGKYKEDKSNNKAKKEYYGKMRMADDLEIGVHYKILNLLHGEISTESPVISAFVKGKIDPELDLFESFFVDLSYSIIVNKNETNTLKPGDTIVRTKENTIVLMH